MRDHMLDGIVKMRVYAGHDGSGYLGKVHDAGQHILYSIIVLVGGFAIGRG